MGALATLQQALGDAGALDVGIEIISGARDLASRSGYQQQLVPKAIELCCELVRYGPRRLQDEFLSKVEAQREGIGVAKDFLPALKETLLHPKRGLVCRIKGATETTTGAKEGSNLPRTFLEPSRKLL